MKNAAIGIVFSEDKKKILTVLRKDIPIWVLPGGGIEQGESAEQAVEREVFEETGVTVQVARKVGTYLPINRLASQTEVFECEVIKLPKILTPQPETVEVSFSSIDALPKTFFFLHKEWLDDALKREDAVCKQISSVTWKCALALFLRHPLYAMRYIFSRLVKYKNT